MRQTLGLLLLMVCGYWSETSTCTVQTPQQWTSHTSGNSGEKVSFWETNTGLAEDREDSPQYEPGFSHFDRSLIGRAPDEAQSLQNNVPGKLNINAGQTQYWYFPQKVVRGPGSAVPKGLPTRPGTAEVDRPLPNEDEQRELMRRDEQDSVDVYVSLNTCDQPTSNAPQLHLYASRVASNQKPGPSQNEFDVPVVQGHASHIISAVSDVYFAVSAPAVPGVSRSWNYELTASIDGAYARHYNATNLFFIDSDSHTALLYTNDTVPRSVGPNDPQFQAWLNIEPPPFSVWLHNQNDSALDGMQNSICALQSHAQLRDAGQYATGMTLIGGGQPKQQFYVKQLNASSAYQAYVGIKGNSTATGAGVVNGGGRLWAPINLTTKGGPNCAIVYNLSFCSDVAYAVPSNPQTYPDMAALAQKYDSYAEASWNNFSKSLQQIPCNTTASAQYSLAVDCGNCTRAYKRWLCTVSIPRCEDWSNQAPFLQPRAMGQPFIDANYAARFENNPLFNSTNKDRASFNSSRNPLIDIDIRPGPYKEVLPCGDLCYSLVRGCPSALQFACPLAGHGLELSYGENLAGYPLGTTCNNPDADLSGASIRTPSTILSLIVFVAVTCLVSSTI